MDGTELVKRISATRTGPGECVVWWLGQHSFAVRAGDCTLYLDLFLSDKGKRLVKPFFDASEVTNASLFFGSHDHRDHIDRSEWPALAAASPNAPFIVPEIVRPGLAADTGIALDRFVGMDDGRVFEVRGVRVTALASAHELLHRDPASGLHPFLGFVIEVNGCTLYHSGDTCMYEGLQTKLQEFAIDLAMLPINGRDAERLARNCIGNLTYQEAADLAGAIRPALTIPTHYDMFEGNLEDPELFTAYMQVKYGDLRVMLPSYAAPFTVRAEPLPASARAGTGV